MTNNAGLSFLEHGITMGVDFDKIFGENVIGDRSLS